MPQKVLLFLTLAVAVCVTNQLADQIQHAAKDEDFRNAPPAHFTRIMLPGPKENTTPKGRDTMHSQLLTAHMPQILGLLLRYFLL